MKYSDRSNLSHRLRGYGTSIQTYFAQASWIWHKLNKETKRLKTPSHCAYKILQICGVMDVNLYSSIVYVYYKDKITFLRRCDHLHFLSCSYFVWAASQNKHRYIPKSKSNSYGNDQKVGFFSQVPFHLNTIHCIMFTMKIF